MAAALAAVAAVVVVSRLDGGVNGLPEPGRGTRPVAARAFADSVGVNIHLTYTSTAYGDFDRLLSSLRDLGVRHVRDGLVMGRPDQEEQLERLADAGIRATLIMGAPSLGSVADEIAAARRNVRVVEALEGPNEYDVSGDPDWASALLRYQRDLYRRAKADPVLRDRPVYGPALALVQDLPFLGSLRDAMDVPTIHPYPGGGPPEGALAGNHAALRRSARMRGAIATETGYHNARSGDEHHPGVEESVAADYLPRLFLSAFTAGYRRTFWYELADVDADPGRPDANFGLLRADLSPKPAYAALRNLMRLVSDAGGARTALRPLELSVSGSDDVRQLLLQKGDGTYLLALWRAADLSGPVDPVWAGVELPRAAAVATLYRPSRSPDPVTRLDDVERIRVPLAGDATVVHIEP